MMHARQLGGALALALLFMLVLVLMSGWTARAWAEPPANAPEPRAVRKLGGAHGESVEAKPALQQAREEAHEAMKEAREAMQKVPKDTHAAVEQAREAMKQARDQAREEMRDAREEMQKARAQGHEAIEEAKAAMVKAREQVQQALPGVPGAESRKDQARYARRLAWHALMNRVARPNEIAPAARLELRHHALRMARLQRIHALAASKRDAATMTRCDALLAREETRHRERLATLLPLQRAQPQAKAAPDTDDEDPSEAEGAEDEEQENEP